MSDYMEQEILHYFNESGSRPLTVHELEDIFELEGAENFKKLVQALNELENSGHLVRTRKNRYGLPEKMNLIRGKIEMNKKGFAFLIPDDEKRDDVYIHSSDLNSAMNGDTVIVRLERGSSSRQRAEGAVIRVIERANNTVVGTFEAVAEFGMVVADERRILNEILIPEGFTLGAVTGHKVIVEITKYPERGRSAQGAVVQILGHKNDPGVDILSIIYKHGIEIDFTEETLEQVSEIPDSVQEADLEGRRDLRDETIVTIDGEDAKDLDDAIRVDQLDNGNMLLGVYIADVSYYIPEGSPLDEEAFDRATSVYLVDRVIPMIPHRLSNGICSLNKGEDRLALGIEMEIDAKGDVVHHEIFEAVIRSTERMTYTDVNKILVDQDEATREKFATLVPQFELMETIAMILRQKRRRRGAIDFDFKEPQILVDEEGAPTDVVIRERSVGERLIEEFMLCANETVAEHFHWLDVPFLYRIHEDPDEGKLEYFFQFLASIGHVVKGTAQDVHPLELQRLLERIKGEQEELVISKLMLRSLKQAKYDPNSVGHFGLSTQFYTHFTAPIRRYPDLTVHRLIRKYLIEGDLSPETINYWKGAMGEIARHSSEKERAAVDTERDVDDLKKAEYMADKIGEEYEGVISSVTSFGLFVELENTIEGLVHVSFMADDYYHYSEQHQALIGEMTSKVYRIGEPVKVKVTKVNVEERAIDFHLIEE